MTMPMRRLGGALSITFLSIAISACGGSTPSAALTTDPPAVATPTAASAATPATPGASIATTGRIEVKEQGFAVTLPDGWTRVDLSAADMGAIMEAAGNVDPALAEQYNAQIQAMLASGLAVYAFGPDPATNVNVMAIPGAGLSLDLLEQMNTAQIEALAGTDVTAERITLPGGDAIHYRYELSTAGMPAGTSIDQYLMVAGAKQLVITVTNAPEADGRAIANSIEVLD
jgi:hypothetical protein